MSEYKFENNIPLTPFNKGEGIGSLMKIGVLLLLIGVVLIILAFMFNPLRASYNSIISFMFLMSIGICSLFLVCLEYLVGSIWSVPFRRTSEILSRVIIFAPLLAIPVLFYLPQTFEWANSSIVAKDEILIKKIPYLNTNFFIIRLFFICLIMWLFYYLISRNSRKQDVTYDQLLTKKNIRLSAVFMPIFALSVTILAIDWLMSLEPHWFSTIFGIYYFGGSLLAALAALTYIVVKLDDKGFLPGIRRDHYYSLGALMFAFTNFWAYIAFSQFMLIWYANLPEETFWFLFRGKGSWMIISLGIILVRFIVPYVALLSQPSKSNKGRLKFAAIWILFSHLYDLYWLVMPNYSKSGAIFSWYELAFPIFSVGLIILIFYYSARKQNLIPIGDPKLQRAMEFRL